MSVCEATRSEPQKKRFHTTRVVFGGMITFTSVKKQEFLEYPKRNTGAISVIRYDLYKNYNGKRDGAVNCACPATKCNMLCIGSGFELLHRVFKRKSYYFDSGKVGLEREHVCITFTKPAGRALQALTSLFTVERREILVALKSAMPWSETLKYTLCKMMVFWGEMIHIYAIIVEFAISQM